MSFLDDLDKRAYTTTIPAGFTAEGLYLSQNANNPLEVGVLSTDSKPSRQDITKAGKLDATVELLRYF